MLKTVLDSIFTEAVTLRQHVVLLCLKVKKATTYRDLVDELIEMPRIRGALGLDSIPALSTFCKTFAHVKMGAWRVVLNVSLTNWQNQRP